MREIEERKKTQTIFLSYILFSNFVFCLDEFFFSHTKKKNLWSFPYGKKFVVVLDRVRTKILMNKKEWTNLIYFNSKYEWNEFSLHFNVKMSYICWQVFPYSKHVQWIQLIMMTVKTNCIWYE